MHVLAVLPDAGDPPATVAEVADGLQVAGFTVAQTSGSFLVHDPATGGTTVAMSLQSGLQRLRREGFIRTQDSDPLCWRTKKGRDEVGAYDFHGGA